MGNGCAGHEDKILTELKEVRNHLSGKIECIEKKLLDPDKGLYARVRKNTEFRKSAKKWLWGMAVMVFSWTGRAVYEFFKGKP
jgi:hypothetical protein